MNKEDNPKDRHSGKLSDKEFIEEEQSLLNKSNLEIEKDLDISVNDGSNVESPRLLTAYMCLAGFISYFPLYMMLTEVDIF